MYIARILYPVQVLGPGRRIGIWFCGCPHGCDGCSNPELWEFQEQYRVSTDTAMALIRNITSQAPIDGFTVTGGEPFYQYDDLRVLLRQLAQIHPDILVYTGYTAEQLAGKDLSDIAVLIDGPYVRSRNNSAPLRGSDNQKVHILKKEYTQLYQDYMSQNPNRIQNFTLRDSVISVGIHRPDFKESFESIMKEKVKANDH